MQVIDSINAIRAQIKAWKLQSQTVAFVPTMGNLHQGHLSLVQKAQTLADKVVVSVFVNPMQFDDQNDLAAYPRTLQQDIQCLTEVACDVVFTPTSGMMYPLGMKNHSVVNVPGTDDKLCGLHREGHFDGVATVVSKLFNIVQADIAIFGEKDYQQLSLIKKLVADLNIPIDIVAAPTHREQNGLAMSSRNQYLTEDEKVQASAIFQRLTELAEKLHAGEQDYEQLQKQTCDLLAQDGFEPEYVDIRNASNLSLAKPDDKNLRILAAARLGKARLIDNIACNLA
jgi:pantoate--beta-alanine ligase